MGAQRYLNLRLVLGGLFSLCGGRGLAVVFASTSCLTSVWFSIEPLVVGLRPMLAQNTLAQNWYEYV